MPNTQGQAEEWQCWELPKETPGNAFISTGDIIVLKGHYSVPRHGLPEMAAGSLDKGYFSSGVCWGGLDSLYSDPLLPFPNGKF